MHLFIGVFIAMFMGMSTADIIKPRLLRAVQPPLGSYFRVGRDYRPLQTLLAESRADFSGLVFDAWDHARQGELCDAALGRVEAILDTRAFELSTARGATDKRLAALPWAGDVLPHTQGLLTGDWGRVVPELIAEEVASRKYSAVLAPTHFLSATDNAWLEIDIRLNERLRSALDRRGLSHVTIYFPLAIHGTIFGKTSARAWIIDRLAAASIDALWLRVHPFGAADAGPLALRRYIEGARDFQRLGIPVVGEHTGTAGLAMLAFGALGSIESGVTFGERFDAIALTKPPRPEDKPYAPAPRVYVARLGVFMSRDQASALMAKPGMRSLLGCRDTFCCPRGVSDTDRDPRRHFLLQRQREVAEISRRPEPVRPSMYLEEFLRPATDYVLRAAKVDPKLERSRKRLEDWRLTLGAMNQEGLPPTVALAPEGKRTHPHLSRSA